MKKTKKFGFTLIELLVVISIIGILASMSTVSLNSARRKARDVRRLSDGSQLQLALYLYYDSNNGFPVANMDPANAKANWPILVSAINGSQNGLTLMKNVPVDPINTGVYVYGYNSDGNNFILSFNLEEGGFREVRSY